MKTAMLIGLFVALALVGPVYGQTPSVDPQSLVGEWSGEAKGTVTAKYVLTILRADGNTLVGRVKAEGPSRTIEYLISGKLEGKVFTYESEDRDLTVTLNVEGNTMTGTGIRHRADVTATYRLTRQK